MAAVATCRGEIGVDVTAAKHRVAPRPHAEEVLGRAQRLVRADGGVGADEAVDDDRRRGRARPEQQPAVGDDLTPARQGAAAPELRVDGVDAVGEAHSPTSSVRRSRFRILPAGLRGSGSSRNQMRTGTLNAARRSATCAFSSSSDTVLPGASVHDRADLLAQHLVGDADDRGVGDGGMLEQRGLDLDAVHVLAAADDHVLGAVDDEDEALVVEPGDVARCAASRR